VVMWRCIVRRAWPLLLAVCLTVMGAGCSRPGEGQKTSAHGATMDVVDAAGRTVAVPQPLKRVVVLASQPAEVIAALGCKERVVGVTEDHVLRDAVTRMIFQGTPSVGSIRNPSVEKILELRPQAVISIGAWQEARQAALDLAERLAPHGIPVICLDCFPDAEVIFRDVATLGKMFGAEQRAQEYVSWFKDQLEVVAQLVGEVEPARRVRVYLELADYTVTEQGHRMIVAAGGVDICGEVTVAARVSPEVVLEKNPDVIVVRAMPPGVLGYGAPDLARAKSVWEGILGRPGWHQINAVQNKRVHLLAFEIFSAPRAPIGILWLAKWFYPDLCRGLDPDAVHRQFLERFLSIKEYPGTFVYPPSTR